MISEKENKKEKKNVLIIKIIIVSIIILTSYGLAWYWFGWKLPLVTFLALTANNLEQKWFS